MGAVAYGFLVIEHEREPPAWRLHPTARRPRNSGGACVPPSLSGRCDDRAGRPRLSEGVLALARRVLGVPVARDLLARRDPDALALLHVGEEPVERPGPAGAADDAAVEADRHHPTALLEQLLQAVRQVLEEIGRGD